jgi:hypothetical protein
MVKILQAFRTVADLERNFGALFEAVVRYVTARGDYSVQDRRPRTRRWTPPRRS